VHRILELIAKNGLENWSTAKVQSLQPTWQNWLQQRGHTPEDARSGSQEAVQALTTTLESETGRWLLAAHDQSAAEQAWTSRDGESALNHIIDRTFIADGVRWIVDYKTVRADEDELPARAEGFRPQLERYAALFAGEGLPVKMAVWFGLQGRLVALS